MCTSRTLVRVAVLFVAISQASCFVTSVHPLADPEQCVFDEQLVGLWKDIKDDGSYVFIGRPPGVQNRPDGLMAVHGAKFGIDRELNWDDTPGYFFPVKIGENHYLQATEFSGPPKIAKWESANVQCYLILKYQVAADRLTLWALDRDAAKKSD
jgi:hypothetical protein